MKILVVGGGSMGQAFIRGLNASSEIHEIEVVEPDVLNAQQCESLNVRIFSSIEEIATATQDQKYDVCILAVKPQNVAEAAQSISETLEPTCVIVSIAAGVTLQSLAENLGSFPTVRAMPNIAASILLSATAMCCADRV